MDSASKKTLINSVLSQKHNLAVLGKEKIAIHGFGSKPKKYILRNKVKVSKKSICDSQKIISIKAIETPPISEAEIETLS